MFLGRLDSMVSWRSNRQCFKLPSQLGTLESGRSIRVETGTPHQGRFVPGDDRDDSPKRNHPEHPTGTNSPRCIDRVGTLESSDQVISKPIRIVIKFAGDRYRLISIRMGIKALMKHWRIGAWVAWFQDTNTPRRLGAEVSTFRFEWVARDRGIEAPWLRGDLGTDRNRFRYRWANGWLDADSPTYRGKSAPIRLGFERYRCRFGLVPISLGSDSAGFRGSWEPRSLGFEISTHQDRLVRPIDDSVDTSCADMKQRGTESGKGPV